MKRYYIFIFLLTFGSCSTKAKHIDNEYLLKYKIPSKTTNLYANIYVADPTRKNKKIEIVNNKELLFTFYSDTNIHYGFLFGFTWNTNEKELALSFTQDMFKFYNIIIIDYTNRQGYSYSFHSNKQLPFWTKMKYWKNDKEKLKKAMGPEEFPWLNYGESRAFIYRTEE